jgi:NAD(P)-dependent dehydrogenase (short-subunit alcohol dehydrogenase family)
MNLELEGKLALVSGSTAGIGFAIAKALAAESARVIINGRTDRRVKEAIKKIRAKISGAKLEALAVDLSSADGATTALKRFPDVDILVNNLGVYSPKPFEQISDADWLSIIEPNSPSRLSPLLPRRRRIHFGFGQAKKGNAGRH